MSAIPKSRSELFLNSSTVILLVASLAMAGRSVWKRLNPRLEAGPVHMTELVGTDFGALLGSEVSFSAVARDDGSEYKVFYSFLTTCEACTYQKDFIVALARRIPPENFISASSEPPEITESYWDGRLPSPKYLSQNTLVAAGLRGVPTLMILDSAMIVRDAWLGVMTEHSSVIQKYLTPSHSPSP